MEIKITTEQPHLKKVWNLFLTTGWNEEYNLTEEEYANAIKKSSFIAAAYYGDELAGFGRVVTDGIVHAVIYDLIVDSSMREKGIGSKILDELLNFCRENKIRDIQLFSAKGKREFYEKRGFVSRPNDAPGMDYKPAGESLE